eukprot:1040576-Amphidinium_carterae.1
MASWVESCPCHHGRHHEDAHVRHRWESCPLRSKRLPEIASGAFFEHLHKLSCVNTAELYEGLENVHADVRNKCLQDHRN